MRKYPALSVIVAVNTVIAWVVLALFVILGFVVLSGGMGGTYGYFPMPVSSGIVPAVSVWLLGIVFFVLIKAGSELIQVFMQIEENTRPRA